MKLKWIISILNSFEVGGYGTKVKTITRFINTVQNFCLFFRFSFHFMPLLFNFLYFEVSFSETVVNYLVLFSETYSVLNFVISSVKLKFLIFSYFELVFQIGG